MNNTQMIRQQAILYDALTAEVGALASLPILGTSKSTAVATMMDVRITEHHLPRMIDGPDIMDSGDPVSTIQLGRRRITYGGK